MALSWAEVARGGEQVFIKVKSIEAKLKFNEANFYLEVKSCFTNFFVDELTQTWVFLPLDLALKNLLDFTFNKPVSVDSEKEQA